MLFNCSAFVENLDGKKEVKGNATEVGMINYLLRSGNNVDALIDAKNKPDHNVFSIDFTSDRKMGTTVVKTMATRRVFVKGAPDFVILKCSNVLAKEGPVAFSEEQKTKVLKEVCKQFSDQSLRSLLLAYKDIPDSEWETLSQANNNFAE